MRINKLTGVAAAAAIVALGSLAAAGPATATTQTCTNVASTLVAPIGCGGLQTTGDRAGLPLDLTAAGNYWNAKVTFNTDSASNYHQDFTVFAVNGSTTDGPGALGEYVAMYTPDGRLPSWIIGGVTHLNGQPPLNSAFTAGSNDYCLSVANAGTTRKPHWNVVLRNCNSNGTFTYGNNAAVENAVTSGHANKYQVWAPVTGNNGLLFVNNSLSHGYKSGNTPYVLDDSGSGPSGTRALAWPENDGANQVGTIIGCTHPIDTLGTPYWGCP